MKTKGSRRPLRVIPMAPSEPDWDFEVGYAAYMAAVGDELDRTDTRCAARTILHYRHLATKHTPPPGKIAVHLTEAQAEALVSILGQEEWPEEHVGPIQEAAYTALDKNKETH